MEERWKKEDPVVGSTGPSNQFNMDDRSGRLRCSLLGYALCLRAFLSLNDFEFNVIALLEALVSLRLDGTIVDEHIGPIISADKAEALCVIEPFHFTFNSRHVPYSGLSLGHVGLWSRGPVSSLGFATFFGKGRKTPEVNLLPALHVLYPYFGFALILPSSPDDVNLMYVLKKQGFTLNKTSCARMQIAQLLVK